MHQILFICTGNYYRSRFAEIYFNHLSTTRGVSFISRSRGFRMNPEKNKGVLSPHTLSYLEKLQISTQEVGVPTKLELHDLQNATHIIAMDEKEHRTMMKIFFPEWITKVDFWNFEDDYLVSPLQVLPALQNKVEALMEGLIIGETVKSQPGH
jgi:protein-tyrosine phosphatase